MRIVTGHWFQVGELQFVSDAGFRSQRQRLWGAKSWPATHKFLLQIISPTLQAAENPLSDIAAMVLHESI